MKKSVIFRIQFTLAFILASSQAIPAFNRETPVEDSLTLQEVRIVSSFKNSSTSPLRLNTISHEEIASRATARTYPELIRFIPSVYATAESGSYGDAKINIRGFKQENISVLLNGIPISGLTSNKMFWNNWMGLTDATYAVQVQKGVGGSMLSDNSVGGTINIITSATSDRFSVEAGAHITHYGTGKGFIGINSGEIGKGWAISFMGSYVGGNGYVDRTKVDSYAFMLNVSKRFNEHNTLIFTALGSPEKHEQRSTKLSFEEVQEHGLKYNRNWGYRDGKPYNLNLNNYFKPYFTLQHLYNKGRLSMSNSLYMAIGNGGGRWAESKGKRIGSYMGEDGQIAWDDVIAENQASAGTLEAGTPEGSARNIMGDYMAGHTQAGAVVSGTYAFSRNWKLDAGAHYQYYSTWENEKITDLLGGNYWYEDYETNSLAGTAGRNPVKTVGDHIRTDNGKVTNHFTLYAMGNWSSRRWDVKLGASAFVASHRRWDKYNYVEDFKSERVAGAGFSTKAGVLFKAGKGHSIYLNGGVYSRLPYAGTYFASGNNTVSKEVENEKNIITELGYRFVYDRGGVELTAYYTYWKNRTLMSDKYKQIDEVEKVKYMITGMDALHYGAELEAFHRFTRWMKLSVYASIGDWTWQNDVSANIYDKYSGASIGTINVYSNGLHVGDAPQTQVGAMLEIGFLKDFRFNADWQFNDRMYADFDPSSRRNPEDRAESYRIPSCHLLNASLSWNGRLSRKIGLTVFANGYNLLNTRHIERGKDGKGHDLESFRGFWGFGTSFNFGFRFSFRN